MQTDHVTTVGTADSPPVGTADTGTGSSPADTGTGSAVSYRVLATCGVFQPGFRGGGPVRSLAHIIDTVPEDIDLMLVTRDRDLGPGRPYPGLAGRWIHRGRSRIYYLNPRNPRHWLRLARQLRGRPCDLLYLNSLWSPYSVYPLLASAARMLRPGKILIAPRGELSPGALALKPRKKRIFLRLWVPLLNRLGVLWQACSDLEARHIRAAFPRARVLVNGDELDLPAEPLPPPPRRAGPLRLVFISRISPMKNLDLALTSLRTVSNPVELDIYGPVEDRGYWARCRQLMDQLPDHIRVRYLGALPPERVLPTFGRYDAFLFPTRGENFGHVIPESLAASCPVICSAATPWSEVIESGGGTVVHPLTPAYLSAALERLTAVPPEQRWRNRHRAGAAYHAYRQGGRGRHVIEEARHFPGPRDLPTVPEPETTRDLATTIDNQESV